MQFNYNPKEKIWDLSLRLFHIILILLIIGSIVSAKLNFLDIHELFGTSLLGLILFRILWGLIGTHHSRFKNFNLSLSEAVKQFSKTKQRNNVFITKTSLGSYSTIAFIFILTVLPISGLFSSDDVLYDGPLSYLTPNYTSNWVQAHNFSHYVLYCLISLHILAIFYYQIVKKHNLIKRMFGIYYNIDENINPKKIENPLNGIFLLLVFIILPFIFLITD